MIKTSSNGYIYEFLKQLWVLIFFSRNIFILGLSSLNQKNAIHQDLKSQNILVKNELARIEAFLGDVGEAKQFTDQSSMK